jgi:hypothetical protein
MARPRHSQSDEAILLALACGATLENAARSAKVSLSTAKRRMRDPEFQRRLREARADFVQRAAAMLTAGSLESVKTLLSLQSDQCPPTVRLGAARAVVELAARLRETAELQDRVVAMESYIAELRGEKDP